LRDTWHFRFQPCPYLAYAVSHASWGVLSFTHARVLASTFISGPVQLFGNGSSSPAGGGQPPTIWPYSDSSATTFNRFTSAYPQRLLRLRLGRAELNVPQPHQSLCTSTALGLLLTASPSLRFYPQWQAFPLNPTRHAQLVRHNQKKEACQELNPSSTRKTTLHRRNATHEFHGLLSFSAIRTMPLSCKSHLYIP
jgi:hypothetical protein